MRVSNTRIWVLIRKSTSCPTFLPPIPYENVDKTPVRWVLSVRGEKRNTLPYYFFVCSVLVNKRQKERFRHRQRKKYSMNTLIAEWSDFGSQQHQFLREKNNFCIKMKNLSNELFFLLWRPILDFDLIQQTHLNAYTHHTHIPLHF